MSSFSTLLTTLGRWPRRLAALACLLLAAASAFGARRPPDAARAAVPTAEATVALAGERAVPVQVTGLDARAYLRPGDHVDLLAAPADDASPRGPTPASAATATTTATTTAVVVAEDVRVLAVVASRDGPSGGGLVVAADRGTALQIAAQGGGALIAVVRDRP